MNAVLGVHNLPSSISVFGDSAVAPVILTQSHVPNFHLGNPYVKICIMPFSHFDNNTSDAFLYLNPCFLKNV